jgi:DNA-binding FadR family transcriptional regulator
VLAETLAADIRSGRHKVGERLPSIGELVTDGHSQGVARLALEWLAEQGWVRPQHGKGYLVLAMPPEPPEEPEDWSDWRRRIEEEVASLRRDLDDLKRNQ